MNHPGGSQFEARPAETDSLLQTLLGVCNRYGIQKSAASFLAGLPSTERLSVEHGTRAMQAAGFAVKLVKRDPSTLPNELLPAVLLNKDILSSNNYALALMSSRKLTVDSILFVAESIVNQVNKENSNIKN